MKNALFKTKFNIPFFFVQYTIDDRIEQILNESKSANTAKTYSSALDIFKNFML